MQIPTTFRFHCPLHFITKLWNCADQTVGDQISIALTKPNIKQIKCKSYTYRGIATFKPLEVLKRDLYTTSHVKHLIKRIY